MIVAVLFLIVTVWAQAALAATITITPGTVPPGASITTTWEGITAPYPNDWMGFYPLGAPDVGGYLDWSYVNCTKGSTVSYPAGSCPGTAPAGTGSYEMRLFTANTYTRLAVSNTLIVQTSGPPPTGQWLAVGDCDTPIATLDICYDQNTQAGIYPRGAMNRSADDTYHSVHYSCRKAFRNETSLLALPDGAYICSLYAEGWDGLGYRQAGYLTWKTDGNSTPGHLGSTAVLAVSNYDTGAVEALSFRGKFNDYSIIAAPKDFHLSGERVFFPRQAATSLLNYACIDTAGKLVSQESPCR